MTANKPPEGNSADGTPSVADKYELRDTAAPAQAPTLDDVHGENVALRDQVVRLAADFENFRKRSKREQDDVRRFGNDRLIKDLLPVLDNLERALSHATESGDPVVQGVRMVAKSFSDILSGFGVTVITALGQPFDPNLHEAIGHKDDPNAAPGVILAEVERGYMLHERLLRPAKVLVAAHSAQA